MRRSAPRAIASRASAEQQPRADLVAVPLRVDRDRGDVRLVERHHQPRVARRVAADPRDEVRARRRAARARDRNSDELHGRGYTCCSMRSTERTWRRRIGWTCTVSAATSGSAAIATLRAACALVPVDLGVAPAQVQRPELGRRLELLALGARGRELDERGRARRRDPAPATSAWSSAANSSRNAATPSPASSSRAARPRRPRARRPARRARAPRSRTPAARRRAPAGSERAEHLAPAGVEHRDDRAGSVWRSGYATRSRLGHADHRDAQRLRHHLGGGDADAQPGEQARARCPTAIGGEVVERRRRARGTGTRSRARAARRARRPPASCTSPSTRAAVADRDATPAAVAVSIASTSTSAVPTRRRRARRARRAARAHATPAASTDDDAVVVAVARRRAARSSRSVGQQRARPRSPHSTTVTASPPTQLVEPEVVQLLEVVEAVDVDVHERQSAVVLAHERERRAHHRLVDAERDRDALGAAPSCPCRGRRRARRRRRARSDRAEPLRRARASRSGVRASIVRSVMTRPTRRAASARLIVTKSARACASAAPPLRSTADGWSAGMSTAPSRNGNSWPRSFVMPSLVSSSSLVAKLPSVTTTRGSMNVELRLEVRPARLDLERERVAVARRPALHDVGDVDLVAGEPDALDQAGEQPAGPADERLAVRSSCSPGPSPTNIRSACGSPDAEHHLGAGRGQRALRARERLAFEVGERGERRWFEQRHGRPLRRPAVDSVRVSRDGTRPRRGPPRPSTSVTITRSRSRCASTAPVAHANARSPS